MLCELFHLRALHVCQKATSDRRKRSAGSQRAACGKKTLKRQIKRFVMTNGVSLMFLKYWCVHGSAYTAMNCPFVFITGQLVFMNPEVEVLSLKCLTKFNPIDYIFILFPVLDVMILGVMMLITVLCMWLHLLHKMSQLDTTHNPTYFYTHGSQGSLNVAH